MTGEGSTYDAGAAPTPSPGARVDEAWAQPLGHLDLVTLELDGAALHPGFSPTVAQYQAYPAPQAAEPSGPGDAEEPRGLLLEIVAEPAHRDASLQVASPTGEVEDLGQSRFRFRGRADRDHHLTITVGRVGGPSRTTVIAVRRTPLRVIDLRADHATAT